MELEQAVAAGDPESAVAHLELARMHRARRQIIAEDHLRHMARGSGGGGLSRTDKEA